MVRTGAKTWLKSCISKPVFLTAQQNSANTLHRKLEEEEGFGTESGLQVPGWKRLDKILHCKQYNKLYSFLQAIVPMALFLFLLPFFIIYIFFLPHPFLLATEMHWFCFFAENTSCHSSLCQVRWCHKGPKLNYSWGGLTWSRTETRAPWALSFSRERICRKFDQ